MARSVASRTPSGSIWKTPKPSWGIATPLLREIEGLCGTGSRFDRGSFAPADAEGTISGGKRTFLRGEDVLLQPIDAGGFRLTSPSLWLMLSHQTSCV